MLWFLKLTSPLVLVIKGSRLAVAKGKLPAATLREVQQVVHDAGIARGTLHAGGSGRYHFSRTIPVEIHQRLRNVLPHA